MGNRRQTVLGALLADAFGGNCRTLCISHIRESCVDASLLQRLDQCVAGLQTLRNVSARRCETREIIELRRQVMQLRRHVFTEHVLPKRPKPDRPITPDLGIPKGRSPSTGGYRPTSMT